MDKAKIRLSAKEMELVTNAAWILTKNGIIEKAKELLGEVQEKMVSHFKSITPRLPNEISLVPPKISKGENYKGLPYLMLDYPRLFDREKSFAIRTMFWWGNFFSITLYLAGSYKKQFQEKCIAGFETFKNNNSYVCINTGEWEHHFDITNYVPVKNLDEKEWEKLLKEKPFIKISNQFPLHQWDNAENNLIADFKVITSVLIS